MKRPPQRGSGRLMVRKEVASQALTQALTKALTFQSPVARNNLERLRRVHPDATPTELAKRVTRYYLSLVTTSGGAMGAAGAIPRWGSPICGLRCRRFHGGVRSLHTDSRRDPRHAS